MISFQLNDAGYQKPFIIEVTTYVIFSMGITRSCLSGYFGSHVFNCVCPIVIYGIHHYWTCSFNFHQKAKVSFQPLTMLSTGRIEFNGFVLNWIETNWSFSNTGTRTISQSLRSACHKSSWTKLNTRTHPQLCWGQDTAAWVYLQLCQIPTDLCSDSFRLNRDAYALLILLVDRNQ